jgi:hypothetical protein
MINLLSTEPKPVPPFDPNSELAITVIVVLVLAFLFHFFR